MRCKDWGLELELTWPVHLCKTHCHAHRNCNGLPKNNIIHTHTHTHPYTHTYPPTHPHRNCNGLPLEDGQEWTVGSLSTIALVLSKKSDMARDGTNCTCEADSKDGAGVGVEGGGCRGVGGEGGRWRGAEKEKSVGL